MVDDLKRRCNSCKQHKVWGDGFKSCPACRQRARNQKHVPRASNLTAELAWDMVEYAKSGMQDEHLAMALKVPPDVLQEWRARGSNSVEPNDPFFILYWEVNAARVKAFQDMLDQWNASTHFAAQLKWVEYSYPDQKPPIRGARAMAPKIPDPPTEKGKVPLQPLEFLS